MRSTYRKASIPGKSLHCWQTRFICKAWKARRVDENDLFDMKEEDDTSRLSETLDKVWSH